MATISLPCDLCQTVFNSDKMYHHLYFSYHLCIPCREILLERGRLRKQIQKEKQKQKEYQERENPIKAYREERREDIKEDNRYDE